MEFPSVLELCDYFRRVPPPHLALRQITHLLASALGVKLDQPAKPRLSQTEETFMNQARVMPWGSLPPDVMNLAKGKGEVHGR